MKKQTKFVIFIKANKRGNWMYFTSHEKKKYALGTMRRLRKLGHNAKISIILDDRRLTRLHE